MSLALLQPAGLAALAALALPILIHLVRRTEERPTVFAALRWIGARFPPRQRLRVSELLLLALRLALLAALALWLAQPVWTGSIGGARAWVLVVPGVDPRAVSVEPGAERHWLAPGFPPLEAPPPASGPTASLMREIDATLPASASITVVAPALVDGLDGERPRLRHAVRVVVEADPALVGAASAAIDVPKSIAAEAAPTNAHPIVVALRHSAGDDRAPRYIRAAVAAWNAVDPGRYRLDVAASDQPWPADAQWLVWLGAPPTPAVERFVERGGTALVAPAPGPAAPDATGLATTQRRGSGRLLTLAAPLAPESNPALLDADFPTRLLDLLRDPAPPTHGPAAALEPIAADAATLAPPPHPLADAFALLVAALFLAERVLASSARRATA